MCLSLLFPSRSAKHWEQVPIPNYRVNRKSSAELLRSFRIPSPSHSIAPSPTLDTQPTATGSPTASHSPTPKNPDDLADQVELGLQVYREQYCGLCHTLTAAGTTGIFGPGHDQTGAIAVQRIADPAYTGGATTASGYIQESIVDPQRYLVPGYEAVSQPMPAYDFLTEEEILALVEALRAQE